MSTALDKRATIQPTRTSDGFREVRGSDGRLYGRYHPEQQLLEIRKGQQREVIDLKQIKP